MRALDPEVANPVWAAVEGLLPSREDNHPLGCHNPRISDRVCFPGTLIRFVTGCSWETAEQLLAGAVSDTTLRVRRDEWVEADVFENLETEALAAYDRIVGLDLTEVSVDGSQHKAPCGGDGTGKNLCDRANWGSNGRSWSTATVYRSPRRWRERAQKRWVDLMVWLSHGDADPKGSGSGRRSTRRWPTRQGPSVGWSGGCGRTRRGSSPSPRGNHARTGRPEPARK